MMFLPRISWPLLAVLIAAASCEARAQGADDALTLARLCVHEAGWDSPDDCTGIYAVISNGAERESITWLAFAHRYSPRFFAGTSRQPWALTLRPDRGPRHVRWSWARPRAGGLPSRRTAFAILFQHCREIFGRPTTIVATDWGSEDDMRRAARLGRRFRVVEVGDTRNVFSVRAGLDRLRGERQ